MAPDSRILHSLSSSTNIGEKWFFKNVVWREGLTYVNTCVDFGGFDKNCGFRKVS